MNIDEEWKAIEGYWVEWETIYKQRKNISTIHRKG